MNPNFNAQHSPMGAFFSFTCGNFGRQGGFGLQRGKPGNQDLYIGVKGAGDAPLKCLPFFHGAVEDGASAFTVDQPQAHPNPEQGTAVVPFSAEEVQRTYGWAGDTWKAGGLSFTIYTPFGSIPDPAKASPRELRDALLPAVVAELEVRNDTAHTQTAVFAMQFVDTGVRLLNEGVGAGRVGFAMHDRYGVLGELDDGETPGMIMRWSPTVPATDLNPVHLLGSTPGLQFEVKPGQTRRLRLALGAFIEGNVTTRLEGRYLYTRSYSGLLDVLGHALDQFESSKSRAKALDAELAASGLSADQQFLIAHSTRSYYGSTQLLDVGGEPFWIVNEGEYCMLNTLDLSVDQVFWELRQNPWVVRNLLDNFVRHYSYVDQVYDRASKTFRPGGISFCHDMGIHNNFSSAGNSSYELPNLDAACFSYMTCEQLCNWIICATSYVRSTGDVAWAKQCGHVITACLESLINRSSETDGFVAYDSSRCGTGGAEITTYDSLDHSLAQTRNNLYMATKCWASYVGLGLLLDQLDDAAAAGRARAMADRAAAAIVSKAGPDGVIPAVFEAGNAGHASRILPAIEGLLYPLAWGLTEPAPSSALHNALRRHTVALLSDSQRRNLFPDGGIRLSSTSDNSWMSKIAIFQHVARRVFGLDQDAGLRKLLAEADKAHVLWQTEGESAYWACSDQMVNGVAKASKYYPRIITTALWLS